MRVWLTKEGHATGWDSGTKTYLQYNGGSFFQVLTPEESEELIFLRLAFLNSQINFQPVDTDEIEMNYR